MKFNTKSAAIVAALAMATTGALALNQTQADAATVATTHSGTYSSLYREDGKIISNRALAPDTPWLVGKIATINGETMYQVSTNEYLRARDSSLNGKQTPTDTTNLVGTAKTQLALYNRHDGKMANRALGAGSAWQVGKVIKNKQGITFVQVSTDEYANAADMTFNQTLTPTYIEDFGMGNTFDGSTSTDTNTDSTDNNQVNTSTTPSTDTNTNNNSTSTNTSTGQADPQATEAAFMKSINAERASKGLSQLTNDPTLQKMADIRVDETMQTHSHMRPNGTKWYTLLPELGITYKTGGENIANEFSGMSPEAMAEDTMDSFRAETFAQNHYDNVMNPDITKMGVSAKYNAQEDYYKIVEEFIG
jgi:Uncharacterized protein with SCP/PR1 domains